MKTTHYSKEDFEKKFPQSSQIQEKTEYSARKIIGHKIGKWLHRSTCRCILLTLLELLIFLWMILLLADKETAIRVLNWVFWYKDYIVLKSGLLLMLFRRRKWLIRNFKTLISSNRNCREWEGIPCDEIAHHIWRSGAFRLKDAQSRFGINWKQHERIAKALEKSGLLIRGASNARVLDKSKFNYQLVRHIVCNHGKNFQIIKDGTPEAFSPQDIKKDLFPITPIR